MIDFGQYPFEPIEKLKQFEGIPVESMYDMDKVKTFFLAEAKKLDKQIFAA